MKIFISWSGRQSLRVVELVRDSLPSWCCRSRPPLRSTVATTTALTSRTKQKRRNTSLLAIRRGSTPTMTGSLRGPLVSLPLQHGRRRRWRRGRHFASGATTGTAGAGQGRCPVGGEGEGPALLCQAPSSQRRAIGGCSRKSRTRVVCRFLAHGERANRLTTCRLRVKLSGEGSAAEATLPASCRSKSTLFPALV
jgi:hypothetical protein